MDAAVFPPFVSFLSAPILIAVVATLHVAVSHFAIGGGLLLYLEERRAQKEGDAELGSWLKETSRRFLYITLTFGAVSGVSIWFIVSLISPLSTTYLIVNFMWVWAMEWAFFILEVFSLLVYVSTWDTVSPRLHRRIGFVYFVSAWLSLFFINGILTFQLTPSKIREPLNLFKAFFNHTFFPSLAARSLISVWIASLFFLFFLAFRPDGPFRRTLARRLSRISLYATLSVPAAILWYGFQASKPSIENFSRISYLRGLMFSALLLFLLSLALTFFLSVLFPQLYRPLSSVIPLLFAVVAFGFCEWTREDLRLPYLVSRATYANDLDVKKCKDYQDRGFAKAAGFLSLSGKNPGGAAGGKLMFSKLCAPCHSISGVNRLDKIFSRVDDAYALSLVRKSTFMKAPMPPFPGGDGEAGLISRYILSRVKRKPPHKDGREIFATRCGPCHDWETGYRTLKDSFKGSGEDEIFDIIGSLDSMTESMPAWTGGDDERRALARYVASRSGGGKAK